MAENFLSKVKVLGTQYEIKDATARADLAQLISDLKTAAYRDVAAAISDADGKIADAATVKAYVDAQVGALNKFDVRVYTELPTASKDTMYILALVAQEGAVGTYVEYITVRSGAGTEAEPYTYAWERIGSTQADLNDYVKKIQTIAGIDLQDNISTSELQTALGLGDLAYKDSASGSTTLSTVDSITMKSATVSGNATVTTTSADATLTKADYTPAGSVTGSAISGGSIDVTLKDQTTATEASLTTATYTPAGTVAAVTGGDFDALKSATFGEDSTNGVQIAGSVSKPDIDLTSSEKSFVTGLTGGKVASFTEGAFTPASISEGFFSAGSQASYSHSGFSGGSLGDATTSAFATTGVVAAMGTAEGETETLILTAATTANAVTAQGEFTAAVYGTDSFTANTLPSIDTTKFNGGSKAADTFSANELQSTNTDSVNNVTAAALHETPVFTGNKYAVATTADKALKEVAFTATNSADIVNKVEYLKQDVDTKTFTPVAATLGFAGTKVENALVTGVAYDKADATAAYSTTITPEVDSITRSDKTISITVE